MKTSSAKAKGRRWQQAFRDLLLTLDPRGMYESRAMGANGSDIIDPAERLPWAYIELRKHETWPSLNAIAKEMVEKGGKGWLYVLGKNRTEPVIVMNPVLFWRLMSTYFIHKEEHTMRGHGPNNQFDGGQEPLPKDPPPKPREGRLDPAFTCPHPPLDADTEKEEE